MRNNIFIYFFKCLLDVIFNKQKQTCVVAFPKGPTLYIFVISSVKTKQTEFNLKCYLDISLK